MFQTPDPQSYSRFLASIGLFLCIAGFLAPGLVLRETSVLRINKVDLHELTPVARGEIERRQRVSRDVGKVAPFGGLVLLVLGVVLLGYAGPRLRHQERTEQERLSTELDKLKRDITPQTAEDRRARLEAEVSEAGDHEADRAPSGQPTPRPGSASRSPIEQYADVERRVLGRLAEMAPPPLPARV